jgi:transcriptional regulator with XRE-family HTH domain
MVDKHKPIARQMGWRVRTGRLFKDLSPDALAERAGLTCRYLERIEAGTAQATVDELVAIAGVLGLPLWFFFDVPLVGGTECPVCGTTRSRSTAE